LATTGHDSVPEFEDLAMGNPDQPHHVDACMIWFCPTNVLESNELLAELGITPVVQHRGPTSVWTSYFGILVDEVSPDLAALTNPEAYVSPQTPPFVIQHGKLDAVVPYVQSVRLAEKLRAAIGEEKVRLTLFEDYVHADRRFETMHNCSIVLDQLEELLRRA
jgi:acetyl esterase/lipase